MDLSEVEAERDQLRRDLKSCTQDLAAMRASGGELAAWQAERFQLQESLRMKTLSWDVACNSLRKSEDEIRELREEVKKLTAWNIEWKAKYEKLETHRDTLLMDCARQGKRIGQLTSQLRKAQRASRAEIAKPKRRVNAPGWAKVIGYA